MLIKICTLWKALEDLQVLEHKGIYKNLVFSPTMPLEAHRASRKTCHDLQQAKVWINARNMCLGNSRVKAVKLTISIDANCNNRQIIYVNPCYCSKTQCIIKKTVHHTRVLYGKYVCSFTNPAKHSTLHCNNLSSVV